MLKNFNGPHFMYFFSWVGKSYSVLVLGKVACHSTAEWSFMSSV